MKYYRISPMSVAMYKGKMLDVPRVTGDKVPREQALVLRQFMKEEYPDVDFIFKPILHLGYGNKTTWERFNFDFNQFIGKGSGHHGFFLSEKMKLIFEKMEILGKHKFYEAELVYKGDKYKSYIFAVSLFYPSPEELLKWEWGWYRGFSGGNPLILEYDGPQIKNYADFEDASQIEMHDKTLHLDPKKIIVHQNFDFAALSYFGGYVVSQRFKDTMDDAGITGVEYSTLKFEIEIEK